MLTHSLGDSHKQVGHRGVRTAREPVVDGLVADRDAGKVPEAVEREQPPELELAGEAAQDADAGQPRDRDRAAPKVHRGPEAEAVLAPAHR
jgi:hypothetical protein